MTTFSQAPKYVADTHALVWHVTSSPRLSARAAQCFTAADHGEAVIFIPVICLVELLYLTERGKIPRRCWQLLRRSVGEAVGTSYQTIDLQVAMLSALESMPPKAIPDMPDRLIVATALNLGVPLITCDRTIRTWNGVATVW